MAMCKPFWESKSLKQMTRKEWESLCDGCGQCCLHKLEDEETGMVAHTNVACRLLDLQTVRCCHYKDRLRYVPDCTTLTADTVLSYSWLPPTCAYRLLAEGKKLMDWHPLISGSPETVHTAGISVQGKTISERDAGDLQDHIITQES